MSSSNLIFKQSALAGAVLFLALTLFSGTQLRAQAKLDAKQTLDAFLKAETVDALLPLVADREAVEPEIRAYYEQGVRKPVVAQKVELEAVGRKPGDQFDSHMFWVTVKNRRIPVLVEETKAGFEVDWNSFTSFLDLRFEKFLTNSESPGASFYVQLRRSHYFGNEVPDPDRLHAFRAQSPIAPYAESYVFLSKDNPAAKEILDTCRWSKQCRPVVELKWHQSADGESWIELVQMVRPTWRR